MKTHLLTRSLVCAALLTALAASPAMAQPDTTTPPATGQETTRLGGEFTSFAGSDTNSQALVTGLRDGTAITLDEVTQNPDGTSTTTETTFQPDTGKMGFGNVKIALSLAEASLAQQGITDPTAAEIEAALNGGTLTMADGTSVDLKGVLAERASGEGWGQIAKSMGFKLGDVMRSPKATGNASAHANGKVDKVELADAKGHSAGHAGRPDSVGKVDRPDRPSRPDRPDRPEHPDHPDHAGRPGG
ncbi:hypothetical protein ACFPPA_17515 [Rhodanobacter ginsengisoli]|uniref:Uncharacterized protein n=1 Tax=Rhodanobacter ginsengisoli TaxID=418646 RepID=A0ABW0QTW1_9GAMM